MSNCLEFVLAGLYYDVGFGVFGFGGAKLFRALGFGSGVGVWDLVMSSCAG